MKLQMCVVVGMSLVAAQAASADQVVFENTAGLSLLHAEVYNQFGQILDPGVYFDPTLAPNAQTNAVTPHAFHIRREAFQLGVSVTFTPIWGMLGGASIARGSTPVTVTYPGPIIYSTLPVRDFGDSPIGPGADWQSSVDIGAVVGAGFNDGGGFTRQYVGAGTVIGFRLAAPGGFRYGFIQYADNRYDVPLRYGYQTEVNVPAVVPAPAAAALLGMGALAASRRRRT